MDRGASRALVHGVSKNSKYVVAVNGDITGHARKSDITRVLEDLEKVNA